MRNEHVDTQYHFTCKTFQTKQIKLKYISISEMIADILTKFLPKKKHFHYFTNFSVDIISQPYDSMSSKPISPTLMVYVGVSPHMHHPNIQCIQRNSKNNYWHPCFGIYVFFCWSWVSGMKDFKALTRYENDHSFMLKFI